MGDHLLQNANSHVLFCDEHFSCFWEFSLLKYEPPINFRRIYDSETLKSCFQMEREVNLTPQVEAADEHPTVTIT